MTRIVGGRWGGRRLVTPRGGATRPTAEKVRAAIANALAATGGLDGARVIDLYAGTGALGLELASRGAAEVVLVEQARAAIAAIRANIAALDADGVQLAAADVRVYASTPGDAFDVIVADPPYDVTGAELAAVLTSLRAAGRVASGADVILERSTRGDEFTWPDGFVATRTKRYGDTLICYGRGS